jgi:hypothetical protein
VVKVCNQISTFFSSHKMVFSCQVIGNINQSDARVCIKPAHQWHSHPISFPLLRHADKQSRPFYPTFNIQQIVKSHSPSQSTTIFKASRQTPYHLQANLHSLIKQACIRNYSPASTFPCSLAGHKQHTGLPRQWAFLPFFSFSFGHNEFQEREDTTARHDLGYHPRTRFIFLQSSGPRISFIEESSRQRKLHSICRQFSNLRFPFLPVHKSKSFFFFCSDDAN